MADSRMNSAIVPAAGTGLGGTSNPATICQGGAIPMRVLVRNNSPVAIPANILVLSYDAATLSNAASPQRGNVYRLPVGQSDIFVVEPGQTLYAIGEASTIDASWAVSDAMPVVHRG